MEKQAKRLRACARRLDRASRGKSRHNGFAERPQEITQEKPPAMPWPPFGALAFPKWRRQRTARKPQELGQRVVQLTTSDRRRGAVALLFSLLVHGLLLSLAFGDADSGLPGLLPPWHERRAHAHPMSVVLIPRHATPAQSATAAGNVTAAQPRYCRRPAGGTYADATRRRHGAGDGTCNSARSRAGATAAAHRRRAARCAGSRRHNGTTTRGRAIGGRTRGARTASRGPA